MKKLILLIIFFNLNSNFAIAQCNTNFIELVGILKLNKSEFENFALKRDYTYDAKKKRFYCSEPGEKLIYSFLEKIDFDNEKILIRYATTNKQNFLEIKESIIAENFKYLGETDLKGLLAFVYSKDNISVLTFSEETPSGTLYMINISLKK